jgi:hypothetical protein
MPKLNLIMQIKCKYLLFYLLFFKFISLMSGKNSIMLKDAERSAPFIAIYCRLNRWQ